MYTIFCYVRFEHGLESLFAKDSYLQTFKGNHNFVLYKTVIFTKKKAYNLTLNYNLYFMIEINLRPIQSIQNFNITKNNQKKNENSFILKSQLLDQKEIN